MGKTKILIVDSKEIFREGLARLLENESDIDVVGTYATGFEAIQKTETLEPDVILLGIEVQDCSGIDAIRWISRSNSNTKIIAVSHSETRHDLFQALKSGARGYVSRDITIEVLCKTIALITEGDIILPAWVAAEMIVEFSLAEKSSLSAELSTREQEVLKLVTKGDTNKEIATKLFITVNTVKVHLRNIMEKLHAENRHQAVVVALEKGIVPPLIEGY